MKLRLIILSILIGLLCCCGKNKLIPKETMVKIYHDIYLLDQSITLNQLTRLADTLRFYEPVIEQYGYTLDDFTESVTHYLKRPDKFKKVFADVKKQFEARQKAIDDSLSTIDNLSSGWSILDSLRTLGKHPGLTTPYYRSLDILFFTRDIALLENYPSPDSIVMKSYKLNALELYDENPFSTDVPPNRIMFMLPDSTTAHTDTVCVRQEVKKINPTKVKAAHKAVKIKMADEK